MSILHHNYQKQSHLKDKSNQSNQNQCYSQTSVEKYNLQTKANTSAIAKLQIQISQIQAYVQSQMNHKKTNASTSTSTFPQQSLMDRQTNNQSSQNLIMTNKSSQISLSCLQKNMSRQLLQLHNQVGNFKTELQSKLRQKFFQLQTQINEKGLSRQIQRAINLSNLLCIQIEQIKQRQAVNEKKINKMSSNLNQNRQQMLNLHNSICKTVSQLNFHSIQAQNILLGQKLNKLEKQINRFDQKQEKKQKNGQSYKKLVQMITSNKGHSQNMVNQIQNMRKNCDYALKSFNQRINRVQLDSQIKTQYLKKVDQLNLQVFNLSSNLSKSQDNLKVHKQKLIHQCQITVKSKIRQSQKQMHRLFQKTLKQTQQKFTVKREMHLCLRQFEQKLQSFNYVHTLVNTKIKQLQNNFQNFQNQLKQYSADSMQLFDKISKEITSKLSKDQWRKQITKYICKEQLNFSLQKLSQKNKQNFQLIKKQQNVINHALCSQNIVARWLWSGEIKGGNLVKWSKQVINTLPQNFIYLDKQYVIQILSSGLYRIQAGFYSKKKPTIQILVNGKVVISAVNTSSYVIHHSSGKLKEIGQNQVTGQTYIDFFMLPENSRLAITCICETKSEGFINISRI